MINISQIMKRTKLEFVKKVQESGDIYSFYFKPLSKFRHEAGQHGLLSLPGGKGNRPFSLASSPAEQYVIVGTHVRESSSYKQALAELKPGDIVSMRGPILNFTFDSSKSTSVMLAQGIGITPFRSMLLHKKEVGLPMKTVLVHVAADKHAYRDITEKIADESLYLTTKEEFAQQTTETAKKLGNDAAYFVSGSPAFIASTKKLLIESGIAGKNIRKDSFFGY